jgi:hypothetical protein
MSGRPPNPSEFGYYVTLAQVGLEMVAPLLLGIWLDYSFGWRPWATLAGVLFGFVGGLVHLILLGNRGDATDRSEPPGKTPC